MFSSEKKTKSSSLIETSAYCIMGGVGIMAIYPPFTPVAIMLNCSGVFGLGYYAWTWSKFDRVFKNLKLGVGDIYPILKDKKKNKYSTVYKFTLPTGLSTEDIENNQRAIEESLGKKIDITYINKGLFIIEEYHNSNQQFYDYEPIKLKGNIPILIGHNRKDKLISYELSDVEPHMIIAGTTGCGKSTSLRSIITNLILTTNVHLHLIDLKGGVEFSVFSKSSKVKSFARTIDEASEVLNEINKEIERRYDLFFESGVVDISTYNKLKKKSLPYELLVVDEMVDLQQKKDVLMMIEIIGAKARSCGIHMILSTQRPDKDILNGRIKINVTNVLGLKTKDGINSKIVIDENGLENLKGKGHGLLLHGGNTVEVQTPNLSNESARELIKHTYIEKVKRPEEKVKSDDNVQFDISDMEVFM